MRVRHLLRRLWKKDEVENDLDQELRACFDILVDRRMAQGMSPADARRATRLEFEGLEQVKEKVREVRVGNQLEDFIQDLRYAARLLWRTPGFSFFAILTIALALGANAAIFTLVDGILLKGVGYAEPERIVQIWEKPPGGSRNPISAANYLDWTRLAQSFESMAAVSGSAVSYLPVDSSSATPISLRARLVSAPFFEVFGVKPAWGRTFARHEDQLGKDKVVVLTHRAWLTHLGGSRDILGRDILLNGQRHTIIGLLPGSSEFDRGSADIFLPLAFPAKVARDYHSYGAYARLKPGVSVEQAQAEMSSIAAGIAQQFPAVKKGWGATVDRFLDRVVNPNLKLSLQVLMWAVVAVLLIGCANLTNLLMARATLRSREIGVRLAIGAGRARVVRMLLTESLLLSLCGGVMGLALGHGLLRWILSLTPPFSFPAEAAVALDGRVLLFLAAATLFTCLAVGLLPAWQASGSQTAEALKEGGRANTAARGGIRARHVFVGAQVAIAFVLLVGGGLMVRSFWQLMAVPLGYDTTGLVAASLPLPMERDPDAAVLERYVDRLLEETRALPGIREVAVTTGLPLQGWGDGMPMWMPGKPDTVLFTGFKIISPSYFRALNLPLRAGRFLDERDTPSSPPVVVVNESFVKRHFPKGNAIGQRILVEKILATRRGLGPMTAWEIVGIVVDEKGRGLESTSDIGTYASFRQNPVVGLGLVARGPADTGMTIKALAQAVARVEKTQVLERPRAVEELKDSSLAGRRLTTSLLGGMAMLALLLACAGIYGVLSFVTAQRTHEMGIRAALGASRPELVRLVMKGGATPVVIGIAIGMAGAWGLARFIRAMLFGTEPLDPVTLGSVSIIFVAVALAACLMPALKAARVDPITALRHD